MGNFSDSLRGGIKEEIVNKIEEALNLAEAEKETSMSIDVGLQILFNKIKLLTSMVVFIDHAVSQGVKFKSYDKL